MRRFDKKGRLGKHFSSLSLSHQPLSICKSVVRCTLPGERWIRVESFLLSGLSKQNRNCWKWFAVVGGEENCWTLVRLFGVALGRRVCSMWPQSVSRSLWKSAVGVSCASGMFRIRPLARNAIREFTQRERSDKILNKRKSPTTSLSASLSSKSK